MTFTRNTFVAATAAKLTKRLERVLSFEALRYRYLGQLVRIWSVETMTFFLLIKRG